MAIVLWRWMLFCRFRWSSSCFYLFPFPVSTAQIIGEFWKNGWSSVSDVAPLVLALYSSYSRYCWRFASGAFRRSGGTLAVPIGGAERSSNAKKKFSQIFFYIHCTSPIGRVWSAEPIVLVQHKEKERIGEAQTHIRSVSSIREIA